MFANTAFMDGKTKKAHRPHSFSPPRAKRLAAHPDRPAWRTGFSTINQRLKPAVAQLTIRSFMITRVRQRQAHRHGRCIVLRSLKFRTEKSDLSRPSIRVLTNPSQLPKMLKAVADHKGMGLMDPGAGLTERKRPFREGELSPGKSCPSNPYETDSATAM